MANEAVLRDRLADAIDFTVADGTGIEKGALLKLTDPRTAIISSGSGDMLAGIAAMEKAASDGKTRLSVYTKGIFDMSCCGAVTLGKAVMSQGADNHVALATTTTSGAAILGYALETGSDGEVIQIFVNVGGAKA